MSEDETMSEERAIGRIEEKLDKLSEKLIEFGTKLTELAVRSELVGILEQRIAKQEGRIEELEKFKLKLVGAAAGIGLLSGAGSHLAATYLAPASHVVEHAAAGER